MTKKTVIISESRLVNTIAECIKEHWYHEYWDNIQSIKENQYANAHSRLGLSQLTEANLNHIMKNAENYGMIIISGNRGEIESSVPNADLSTLYKEFCKQNGLTDKIEDGNIRQEWLAGRNKCAYKRLYDKIRALPYSYSQVYGGFKEDDATAEYEPSFIVYSVDRQGKQLPFNRLFEIGKSLCQEFNQESFFAQAPNEAPNHYDYKGEIQNTSSSKFVKFNREGEEYFTTAKKKKRGAPQRFTSDIVYEDINTNSTKKMLFEYYAKEFGIEYHSKIRRTQWGESLLS